MKSLDMDSMTARLLATRYSMWARVLAETWRFIEQWQTISLFEFTLAGIWPRAAAGMLVLIAQFGRRTVTCAAGIEAAAFESAPPPG